MNALIKGWAALALAGMVGGQAYAQGGPIDVRPTPTHTIDDRDDGPDQAAGEVSEQEAATRADVQGAAPQDAEPGPTAMAAPQARALSAEALRAQIEHEGPSVAIAHRVLNAAGAFDAYMRRAAAISPDFRDGAAVGRAVLTGSAYDGRQLQEGAVAYAALTALQEPRFVQNLNDLGQDPTVRAGLVQSLLTQPETVLRLAGAHDAGALVVSVMGRMGGDLLASGTAMKQAAYDVQHQAWSKEAIPQADARLAEVKARSAVQVSLEPADTAGLIGHLVAVRKAGADPDARNAAPTPVVTRGLALAALAVLGAAGEDRAEQLTPLLSESVSAQCLKMAKLNLYQCLSVAGPHYENVFCLDRHAMMDTGQCVVAAAGWSGPAVNSASAAAPLGRSALVPIALASAGGPERDSVMDGRAAIGPSPEEPAAVPVQVSFARTAPAPRPLLAASPWRPNGPLAQDQFVGGPYDTRRAVEPAAPYAQDAAYDEGPREQPPPEPRYSPAPALSYPDMTPGVDPSGDR